MQTIFAEGGRVRRQQIVERYAESLLVSQFRDKEETQAMRLLTKLLTYKQEEFLKIALKHAERVTLAAKLIIEKTTRHPERDPSFW